MWQLQKLITESSSLVWYVFSFNSNETKTLLLISGGHGKGVNSVSNAVFEFDQTSRNWTVIGATNIKRANHAVSVIKYSDFSKWCIYPYY